MYGVRHYGIKTILSQVYSTQQKSGKVCIQCLKVESTRNPTEDGPLKTRSTSKLTKDRDRHPDFGTYHHATRERSEELRERARRLFSNAFDDLLFSRDDKLKILDIGCGLGFLSCVCAGYYSNAVITGFDTFKDASLKNSSLVKARNNAKILGLSERIKFQEKDFFHANYSRGKFDLFVSNLVFHNFGKKRLNAYDRLAKWVTPRSYVVMGELFFEYEKDYERLTSLFSTVVERPDSPTPYRILVLSEPKKKQ